VATAQRAPRRHRLGHEGVTADGARPERSSAVGVPHPARLRGEPAAAESRSHRPVPDAPCRPGHTVGGDFADDGAAGPGGQDQLRRQQQQLRRVGRGYGPVRRLGAALPGPHFGAEPVQPCRTSRGNGDDSRATQPRHRLGPIQPAPCRRARRGPEAVTEGRFSDESTQHRGARPARSLRGAVSAAAREAGGRRAGLALAQPRRLHRHRRSVDDRGAASGPRRTVGAA
jgi:hypothetical protein